ncbi:MAG TPA: DUF2235 domain-containing protein [Nordella sp.]|nr:DUF2235 domain-containing protein [Nordella sp.]
MPEPKNIVICLDGTGNSMVGNATNVIRIFQLVRNASDRQIAYYAPGVGTQTSPGKVSVMGARLRRLAGMAFGYGTIADVENAYSFIANNYQAGDRLFFFGFSRGAYSVRFLASVIHQIGLLPAGQTQLLPHAIRAALAGDEDTTQKFAGMFCVAKPKIAFLGLFDTVKSGFYFDDSGWKLVRTSLPYSWYNPDVLKVRQAMALDERRAFYPINRWIETKTNKLNMAIGDVEQVWFAGDHSDIGGGYPEASSKLYLLALRWIVAAAVEAGMAIDRKIYADLGLDAAPDHACEPMHDRLAGSAFWWICEGVPRFAVNDDDGVRKTLRLPRGRGRFVPAGSLVHASVRERRERGRDAHLQPYAPRNLPAGVEWVEGSGVGGGNS